MPSKKHAREMRSRWNQWSIVFGGFVWVVFLVVSLMGHGSFGAIERLFLLAPLVIVPLGAFVVSKFYHSMLHRIALYLQPFAAVSVLGSFLRPKGAVAAGLASGWLLFTSVVGLSGVVHLISIIISRRSAQTPGVSSEHKDQKTIPLTSKGTLPIEACCFVAGFVFLPIGGVWLFLSRLGVSPMGFKEPIVLLTALHFHYTGFCTPLLFGLTGRAIRATSPNTLPLFFVTAIGFIGGIPLIALGFVCSDVIKVFSVLLVVSSLFIFCVISTVILPHLGNRPAQILLAISALSVVIGMALAGIYEVGEYTGHLWLNIPQMAQIHGTLNGIGFALCGLLGWLVLEGRNELTTSR